MSEFIQIEVKQGTGIIRLNRPQALNSLSLDMIRAITARLLAWRTDPQVHATLIRGNGEKAFCAGGDIRAFYELAKKTPQGGSALIEDFFTEEYLLNQLIHHYPKPYVAFMSGIVMGGGMGISQCFSNQRMRIVTETTRMAMPEVNIGIFPDIGASYFLSRCPGKIGMYLALTGLTINAADALYAGLADIYLPANTLDRVEELILSGAPPRQAIREFAQSHIDEAPPSSLSEQRELIDRHFAAGSVDAIMASLANDQDPFAQAALAAMQKRSPLMLCVAHEQLTRAASMTIEECLRMERSMMRHCFEGGEALEGIRAMVIDKDQSPRWHPTSLEDVSPAMVQAFFTPAWPDYGHPLRSWLV